MSHFTVLIIGENPEAQLDPFQEGGKETVDREYLEFDDMEEKLQKEYKTGTVDMVKTSEGLMFEWKAKDKGLKGKKVKVPYKEHYKTIEHFAKDWHGLDGKDEETGKYGYWHNPNAKWDWYSLGGRWTGAFKLKPAKVGALGRPGVFDNKPVEGYVDQAVKGDIDWEGMSVDSKIAAEKSWDAYQKELKAAKTKGEKTGVLLKYGGLSGMPKTKEKYLKDAAGGFSTYAVLKDGVWYERGQMGWWGMSSNEKSEAKWDEEFTKLMKNTPENVMLSVYDCHI